jgi:ATP-dependent DNA helicase DinG
LNTARRADEFAALLGADGPLARLLPGFNPRPEQQAMAIAIANALATRGVLICEAGTGTGKTFAYLVPALVARRKTIVSTATKALQDQLFHRDLPLVRRALGAGGTVALLKGRQNYVCHQRLERALGHPEFGPRRMALVERIRLFAEHTDSGDLEAVPELDDDRELKALVTSTTENCLGQDCPYLDRCFVAAARRDAASADLVVVNHHLLFADLALRETGFAELLPNAEAIVLDEAHKLPEIASTFFSRSVSTQQLLHLCRDLATAVEVEAPDATHALTAAHEVDNAQRDLRDRSPTQARRLDWRRGHDEPGLAAALGAVEAALAALQDALADTAERGPMLQHCAARALDLATRWSAFGRDDPGRVRWLELAASNVTLFDTPVSVAQEFAAKVAASDAAWVMTSATLAVAGRFDHFRAALGLAEATEALWASPFDYATQSLLYLPALPLEPGAPEFERVLVAAALPVLTASRGRAFFLFTSHRSLARVADLLRAHGGFPLLVQGDAPPRELLRRFRSLPDAVLLGTATFWEGVDVRGEALSVVIIDKLPFGVPDDPVMQARGAALREAGGNPFLELQVPAAVTALKQGAGRLIRDRDDRGVLMLGDVRVRRRPYGRVFLDSLPPMPITDAIADVERFFAVDDANRG